MVKESEGVESSSIWLTFSFMSLIEIGIIKRGGEQQGNDRRAVTRAGFLGRQGQGFRGLVDLARIGNTKMSWPIG